MPQYVYRCRLCDYKFPVIHAMKEVIQVSCPRCGGTHSERVPQPFAFRVEIPDAGQRRAKEIAAYLNSKRDKARAEAAEYNYRKANEKK